MDGVLMRYLRSLRSNGVRRVPRPSARARGATSDAAAPTPGPRASEAAHAEVPEPLERDAPRALPRDASRAPAAAPRTPADGAPRRRATAEEVALLRGEPAPLPPRPDDPAGALAAVATEVAACRRCALCETRGQTVPGEGDPNARVVFVGEGPGADEDRTGRPFVGRAGQLLDDIITKGMKRARDEVYICNVVKCRPPGNRVPLPDETAACGPYLERQLEAIQPKVICALGATAARHLLGTELSMARLRGGRHAWRGIPVIPTYHPAYLLRNPEAKRPTWEDIQKVMEIADRP